MANTPSGQNVVLAASGATPRLEIRDITVDKTLMQIECESGIYAVHQSARGLAWGSRGGRICACRNGADFSLGEENITHLRKTGGEVLSIMLTQQHGVIASDTIDVSYWAAGLSGDTTCIKLDTEGDIVCALNIVEECLYGLTVTGNILCWKIPEMSLLHCIAAPTPAKKGALVQLTSWPASGFLAYPGNNGHLVFISPSSGVIQTYKAHANEFYLVLPWKELLMTCGRTDHLLRVWNADTNTPVAEYSAPLGVISGIRLPGIEPTLLIVDDTGKAFICTLQDDELHCVRAIDGENYRACSGPAHQALEAYEQGLRSCEIQRLSLEIVNNERRMAEHDIDDLHQRLSMLGGKHISLEIRAQKARRQYMSLRENRGEHLIEELRHRRELDLLLPDAEESIPSLLAYGEVLALSRQYKAAVNLYERVGRINANPDITQIFNRPLSYLTELESGRGVIALDHDVPMETFIESCNILSTPIRGRYAVSWLSPFKHDGRFLDGTSIIAKYNEARNETTRKGVDLPSARLEEVYWIDQANMSMNSVLIFERRITQEITFEFIVPLIPLSEHITPVIVLAVTTVSTSPFPEDACQHNVIIGNQYKHISNNDDFSAWCRETYRAVVNSFSQHANEQKALRGAF